MLEPQPSVERQVFFKPRGWSPVLALVALTLSPVSMQVSQGPAPACAQRGGCGCPQPGPHSGPRGGGVPRRHQPAAAATLPRGHFWLLCGLREWAPGLRYAPSAFWAPQPWDLSKPHWWSELFSGLWLSSGALGSENLLSKGLEFSPQGFFLKSQDMGCWGWGEVALGRPDPTVPLLSDDILKIRILKANYSLGSQRETVCACQFSEAVL